MKNKGLLAKTWARVSDGPIYINIIALADDFNHAKVLQLIKSIQQYMSRLTLKEHRK